MAMCDFPKDGHYFRYERFVRFRNAALCWPGKASPQHVLPDQAQPHLGMTRRGGFRMLALLVKWELATL